MKIKLISVLIAVTVIFIGAVLWRTDSFVYGDRMSWVEAQNRTQIGAISHSLSVEFNSIQRLASVLTADALQKGRVNWGPLNPYFAVASFTIAGDILEPNELLIKESSKASQWNREFVKAALSPMVGWKSGVRFYVKPFQDAQAGRFVAMVFIEGSRALALFGSGEIFQSLIDAQKGAFSSFSIVTSSGLTVGHSIAEYVGTAMGEDPVFKDAKKTGSSYGSSVFKRKSGDIFGMYEVIPQSNLFVLSQAPLNEAMKGRAGILWQFILMGLGLGLVGVAVVLWIVVPTEKQIDTLQLQLSEEKIKAHVVPVPAKFLPAEPQNTQQDKLEASAKVASALAHEMSGPLASILGYCQMILSKHPNTDIASNAESILRETRGAKEVLNKLLGFAGEQVKDKALLKMDGPLSKALKEMEAQFVEKGVTVVQNIQDTSEVEVHTDAIVRALKNIFENSIEAMERMPKKEIHVDLFENEDGVNLQIKDIGEGIDSGNLEKVFDPFFTTRSFANHMGLGLSVALGILKEHNAEIKIESKLKVGTLVQIVFKKTNSLAINPSPSDVPRLPNFALPSAITAPPPSELNLDDVEEVMPQLNSSVDVQSVSEVVKVAVAQQNNHAEIDAIIQEESSMGIPMDLPKLKAISEVPKLPEEINLDDILELPEVSEDSLKQESLEAALSEAPSDIPEEDRLFIESILDETTPSSEEQMASEQISESLDLEEVVALEDTEISPQNLVLAPTPAMKKKEFKLDSYEVEVRRPGKRT